MAKMLLTSHVTVGGLSQHYAPPDTSLPKGFPLALDGPMTWTGESILTKRAETILELSKKDLAEIDSAIAIFKSSGRPMYELSASTFPLPSLAQRFSAFKHMLHSGYGFFTIRGLKPSEHSDEENNIIHVGISSYFGDQRALQQNYVAKKAEALLHVADVRQEQGKLRTDVYLAPGNQSHAIGFHSDNGDNVSLYCRQTAVEGGELYLTSMWTIYNELAKDHPSALRILAAPWVWQTARNDEKEAQSKEMPLLYFLDGRLVANYQKRPLIGTEEEPRDSRLPPLSMAQEAAINIVDRLAYDNAVSIKQDTGDINFFNNMSILHARSAFTDQGGPTVRRHLSRFIFRDSILGWSIPTELQADWRKYYEHDAAQETFPLKPLPWGFQLSGH